MKIYDLLDILDIFLDIFLKPPQPLMETKWGPHGDHRDVEITWGQHGDNMGTTWGQCGDNMETKWGPHGDHRDVETTWG